MPLGHLKLASGTPIGRPLPTETGVPPCPTERTEFCRRQAERLQRLAQECVDSEIRKQIIGLAAQWAEMAKGQPLLQSVK